MDLTPSRSADPPTFETSLARLEAIVEELANPQTNLEQALERYEEGVRLARQCMNRLNAAELRIQELTLE